MTTVAFRVRKISNLEEFDLVVKAKATGKAVKPSTNGVLGTYPFEKMLKGTKTVSDWRRDRFEATYPGYTCDVLNGEGEIVAPQTSLNTVRESYGE